MKFVYSGTVRNCCHEEEGNIWPMKEGLREEPCAKVYPFTVSFPRYASWRSYVRTLLNQLKSCTHCKAAADAFPTSTLPKVHTLPNGKVLVFKGLMNSTCDHKPNFSRSDNGVAKDGNSENMCSSPLMGAYDEPTTHYHQSLSTFHKSAIEEYDIVSIDPSCPKHGKYSLIAWLQKEGTKVVGMKGRAKYQIYPKTKLSQSYHTKRIKQVQKRDETGRPISSNFSKHILDKFVVHKPSRVGVPSTLKKHKNKNLEFNVLKQIETNTTTNPPILFQKQTNILSTYSHQNNSILEPKQTINSKIQMAHLNSKNKFIFEQALLESNDNKRMNVKITSMEREKCEIPFEKDLIPISNKGLGKDACKCPQTYASQYRRMCCLKELNYRYCFDSCNEVAPQECIYEEKDKLFNGTTIKLRGGDTHSTSPTPIEFTIEEQSMAHDLFEMKKLEQVKQQLEWIQDENDKFVNDIQINLVGNEQNTCTPMWFTVEEHQMAHDMIGIEEVEQIGQLKCVQHENEHLINETRIKSADESSKCAPTWFSIDEHQISSDICNLKELGQSRQQLECVQHENGNLVDETSTCTLTRFTIEEQMTSSIFNIDELEKTRQRLEKIVDMTKSLQLGLNNDLHCDDSPIEKVHLSKVQVLKRDEAREWLSNVAIERATNKISQTCHEGRVRQLVQAFESIK